jgi:hypothetical protein
MTGWDVVSGTTGMLPVSRSCSSRFAEVVAGIFAGLNSRLFFVPVDSSTAFGHEFE